MDHRGLLAVYRHTSRPAIVVLPFVNRSPDPDNEYFSDGLTEEIISDLSVIKALRVISRNSSMTFKGTSKDTLSIAKELGVSWPLSEQSSEGDSEGAIKHVTLQLEQAATWTEYLALFLADGYSLIGDRETAMRWLRTAVAQGFINYPYLATRDPFLVNVRIDPRFAEMMREVKRRWETLAQTSTAALHVEQSTTSSLGTT